MIPPAKRPSSNDEKIGMQMHWLRLIRASESGLEIGWDDGQVIPSVVRALELAGLVTVNATVRPRLVLAKR